LIDVSGISAPEVIKFDPEDAETSGAASGTS